MKFNAAPNTVESSGSFESAGFTFAASAKAFKIFIDGIYSDKIRAIVREIFTNAYDAHILAGKADVAFNCHLPTALEPFFSVRDFGPAITHDNMMSRFTKVFDSTKDESDDFVGSLGLGRLSPFAYTDNFTVVTTIAGTRRTYAVFLNSSNIPELSLLTSEETTDEGGMEVIVPVKVSDVNAFWKATKFTSIGFNPKPDCGSQFETPEPSKTYSTWSVYPDFYGIYAKQGCVLYPVDTALFPSSKFFSIFAIDGLVIDFPIGSLDFNASREALGYTEKTMKHLTAALEAYIETIRKEVESSIASSISRREAACRLSDFQKMMGCGNLLRGISYKGKVLELFTNLKNHTLVKSGVSFSAESIKHGQKTFRLSPHMGVTLDLTSNEPVYVIRTDKKIPGMARRICLNASSGPYFSYTKALTVAHADGPRAVEKIKRLTCGAKLIFVHDLPAPKIERSRSSLAKDMVEVIVATWSEGHLRENLDQVNLNDPRMYVIRERNDYASPCTKDQLRDALSMSDVAGISNSLKVDGFITITASQEERFKKRGWLSAANSIKELASRTIAAMPYFKESLHYGSFYEYSSEVDWDTFEALREVSTLLPTDHIIHKGLKVTDSLVAFWKNSKERIYSRRRLAFVAGWAGVSEVAIHPLENEYNALKQEFVDKYPMAAFVKHISKDDEKVQILLDYLSKEEYEVSTESEFKEAA